MKWGIENRHCPCCGKLSLGKNVTDETCPICFWRDDGARNWVGQEKKGDSLQLARLREGQQSYREFGACDEKFIGAAQERERTAYWIASRFSDEVEGTYQFVEKLVTLPSKHGRPDWYKFVIKPRESRASDFIPSEFFDEIWATLMRIATEEGLPEGVFVPTLLSYYDEYRGWAVGLNQSCVDAELLTWFPRNLIGHTRPYGHLVLERLTDKTWDHNERSLCVWYMNQCPLTPIRNKNALETCVLVEKHGFQIGGHRTDGTWIFPNGFEHYVLDHDVRLPAEFVEHIKSLDFQPPTLKPFVKQDGISTS